MGLVKFASIKKIFGGAVSSEAERQVLFEEALFLTLSRASNSDVNISPVEVETVQSIMQSVAGAEVSAADVRVAAASELYESASLDDYLAVVGRKLLPAERATIVQCLAEVIKSDLRISPREIDFFNWVVSALGATPAEMVGLLEES
jgi:uncharacterized tellurite resistance protein B-like protein